MTNIIERIIMAKKTYLIIRLDLNDGADIDDVIINTEIIYPDDVIDAEIVGSSVEMIFDGEEGHEQTN
jgi:hypothetical protein